MRYLIDYIYGDDVRDTKEGSAIVEAELSENADYEEENRVFKPLIHQKTGHSDIKIMSYRALR